MCAREPFKMRLKVIVKHGLPVEDDVKNAVWVGRLCLYLLRAVQGDYPRSESTFGGDLQDRFGERFHARALRRADDG